MILSEKNQFEKLIKEFNKNNSMIKLSTSDLNELPEEIINHSINSKFVYGIKNSKILTYLIVNKLDEYCSINKKDLIYNNLFFAHVKNAIPTIWGMQDPFYYQIYMTREKIYIYGLDNYARVTSENKFLLNELSLINLGEKYLTIKFGNNTFNLVKTSDVTQEFIMKLKEIKLEFIISTNKDDVMLYR